MFLCKAPCANRGVEGFTLIELLVSIAIMSIILGISLSGGPQAIMRLSLADNAYQAELLIREAQLEGSAINSMNNLYGGAGVFFDRATSTKSLKFRDRVDSSIIRAIGIGNGLYEITPFDEMEKVISTVNNHQIGKLCVATGTAPLYCNSTNVPIGYPSINTLTISFSRPKQTAHIYVNGTTATDYDLACVQFDSLRSPQAGYVRSISVYKSGMIIKKVGTCL